jgi:hypothetical protein
MLSTMEHRTRGGTAPESPPTAPDQGLQTILTFADDVEKSTSSAFFFDHLIVLRAPIRSDERLFGSERKETHRGSAAGARIVICLE